MLNPFKSLNCLKITFRGKRNRQDHVPWFRAQPDLGFVVAIHGSCVKHFELRHLEIGKFHEIPDDAVAYCSFPKIQKNVVGPCWSLPITVFCWGFSFGCLISQLGSLLHDLSSPDFPGKCQLSPNLTTKDKECFPKSTGRFFSWQNILLRGESGWHRFLSCAFYSWPEIHGLKRENADVDGSTPISEFCVPSMYFSLRMSFGTQILASRAQKKETCYFSRIASPVSLISAHFS